MKLSSWRNFVGCFLWATRYIVCILSWANSVKVACNVRKSRWNRTDDCWKMSFQVPNLKFMAYRRNVEANVMRVSTRSHARKILDAGWASTCLFSHKCRRRRRTPSLSRTESNMELWIIAIYPGFLESSVKSSDRSTSLGSSKIRRLRRQRDCAGRRAATQGSPSENLLWPLYIYSTLFVKHMTAYTKK